MKIPLELLAEALNKHNIDYETQINSNLPKIGEALYDGMDGYYIEKPNYNDYNKEQIESLFPIIHKNILLHLVDIADMEIEEDRVIKASIIFLLYENI